VTIMTRRLVEEIYADDLELLGYDFEEARKTSLSKPLYNKDMVRAIYTHSMKSWIL